MGTARHWWGWPGQGWPGSAYVYAAAHGSHPPSLSHPPLPARAPAQAAIFLTGVIGTVAGAQVLLDTMASKIRSGASKIAVLGAFWVVVFLAAKVVLEG